MKQLRILTGNHAGAQVRLAPGTHRVSADEDADIRILDWTGNDVLLAVDEAGITSARRVANDAPEPGDTASEETAAETGTPAAEPGVVLMIDYVPMPFDDTVLCVGIEGAAWPSDLALLSTLLTRTGDDAAETGSSHSEGWIKRLGSRRMLALGACVLAGAVALGGMLHFSLEKAHANEQASNVVVAQRANRAFAEAGLTELHAASDGRGGAIVTGMVSSQSEDYMARQMLGKIAPNGVTRQYGVAEDTARSINEALGIDGTQVGYRGHGVFAVTGTVASTSAVKDALARVRGDLDRNVKNVEVNVVGRDDGKNAVPEVPQGSYSVLVSSSRVQYTETPDGVKHIYSSDSSSSSDPSSDMKASDEDAASAPHSDLTTGTNNDVANEAIRQFKEQSHVRVN
jgi:type III secretion protein D